MLRIREAIIVEGRYDKNTLSQLVDTVILETRGFGIFHDPVLLSLFRRLAEERGLIILTDSDGAGFLIRNHLKGCLPANRVKHAYVPDLLGKERRKRIPGKEGKLGVEGMEPRVLQMALQRAGATILNQAETGYVRHPSITKADMLALGLSGGPGAEEKRHTLCRALALPERLSANALLAVLNALYSLEELRETAAQLF